MVKPIIPEWNADLECVVIVENYSDEEIKIACQRAFGQKWHKRYEKLINALRETRRYCIESGMVTTAVWIP